MLWLVYLYYYHVYTRRTRFFIWLTFFWYRFYTKKVFLSIPIRCFYLYHVGSFGNTCSEYLSQMIPRVIIKFTVTVPRIGLDSRTKKVIKNIFSQDSLSCHQQLPLILRLKATVPQAFWAAIKPIWAPGQWVKIF